MTSTDSMLVGGEPLLDVIRGLQYLRQPKMRPDGMAEYHAELPPEVAAPLFAALMRIDAELLALDADLVSSGAPLPRTPEQRTADALIELSRRVCECLGGSPVAG